MKKIYQISLILLLIIVIAGCVSFSEAPGCNNSPFIGGCFGTHLIKNLTVEPEISCLKIESNNCNNGVIEILNYCEENVTIAGIKMEEKRINEYGTVIPSDLTIDPIRKPSGEIIVNNTLGNYGNYEPTFDDFITINGTVGNTSIKISYVKTKSLC
jgi:hypothetical protein